MIPTPWHPRRGFPWLGLAVAIVIIGALVANWIGGKHGMLMAAIYLGLIIGPLALIMMLIGIFQMVRKDSGDRAGQG